jgi:ABC-type transporter Mla MlaB component
LAFRRASRAANKRLEIRGLTPRLLDLARVYGVADLLLPG